MTPTAATTYDRRLVGWLSVPQLITWGSVFYTFALLMEPLERELGLSRAQSSLAFSLALLAEGLLAYPVGRWIDRGHERALMTGGSLLVALCLLLHSFVTSVTGFYAVWLVLGAALAATLYNPVFAVVTRRFPHDFRRAIITLTFLGGLASTVFIPLSAWLIATLGWRHALWVLAALHLLVCAPLHFWLLQGAPRREREASSHLGPPERIGRPPDAQRPFPADRRVRCHHDGHRFGHSATPDQPAARKRHARSLGDCDSGQHRRHSGAGALAAVFFRAPV
jgi:MFS family permease